MSSKEKNEIDLQDKNAFRAKMLDLMSQADAAIEQASQYLLRDGQVFDLTEWVTIKEYCRRFDIKNTETVSNWIKRGTVPAGDTMVIEEFNNIRMLKAKPYVRRSAKTT